MSVVMVLISTSGASWVLLYYYHQISQQILSYQFSEVHRVGLIVIEGIVGIVKKLDMVAK